MERLNNIVSRCLERDVNSRELSVLSSGERAYVALAANRYDLIDDPIEAWHGLERSWQTAVCEWRGWPHSWSA